MLLLAPGCPPPMLLDELEDWVRDPIDADELDARLAALARRVGIVLPESAPDVHFVDGILRVDEEWTSIPESQWSIVQMLIDRMGTVVGDREIVEMYSSADAHAEPRAVKSMMWRLARRMARVGIEVHKVRGRGYLVELTRRDE
jgi:DNA-binding response OmpR family regulator